MRYSPGGRGVRTGCRSASRSILRLKRRTPPDRIGKLGRVRAYEGTPVAHEHGLMCRDADHDDVLRSKHAISQDRIRVHKAQMAVVKPIVAVDRYKPSLAIFPGRLVLAIPAERLVAMGDLVLAEFKDPPPDFP